YYILNPDTAKNIYDECTAKLQKPDYSVRNLLRRMNVKLVCTTDDPVDSLEYHLKLKEDARLGFEIPVLPAFRPDNAMDTGDPKKISNYIKKLEEVSNISISSFNDYLNALKSRHD